METIEKEKEYIILRSIVKYGSPATPQDYAFLTRNSMLDLYFQILNSVSKGINTKPFEDALKAHAANLMFEVDLDILRKYKSNNGNKKTKELLDSNDYYWKVLLSELKKRKI